MKGKIAFEEHMSLPETLEDARTFAGGSGKWDEFARQILDIGDERLAGMEKNGIVGGLVVDKLEIAMIAIEVVSAFSRVSAYVPI